MGLELVPKSRKQVKCEPYQNGVQANMSTKQLSGLGGPWRWSSGWVNRHRPADAPHVGKGFQTRALPRCRGVDSEHREPAGSRPASEEAAQGTGDQASGRGGHREVVHLPHHLSAVGGVRGALGTRFRGQPTVDDPARCPRTPDPNGLASRWSPLPPHDPLRGTTRSRPPSASGGPAGQKSPGSPRIGFLDDRAEKSAVSDSAPWVAVLKST